MIFESLNSLRRNAVMTSIVLLAFGIVLLIVPETYLPNLVMAAGSAIVIMALEMIFEFLSSNKALIHYIYLTGALALGIVGMSVRIFQSDVLFVLGYLFGLSLTLESIRGIIHSWVYARRSGREHWWLLIPLYVIQIICGIFIMINPWWKHPGEFKQIIGAVIVFASVVSAIKIFWVWPLRKG